MEGNEAHGNAERTMNHALLQRQHIVHQGVDNLLGGQKRALFLVVLDQQRDQRLQVLDGVLGDAVFGRFHQQIDLQQRKEITDCLIMIDRIV